MVWGQWGVFCVIPGKIPGWLFLPLPGAMKGNSRESLKVRGDWDEIRGVWDEVRGVWDEIRGV